MVTFVLPRQPLSVLCCFLLSRFLQADASNSEKFSYVPFGAGMSFFHTSDLLLALFSSLISHPSLVHLLLLPFLSPHHFPPHPSLPPFLPSPSLLPLLPPSLSPSLSLSFHIFVLSGPQLFIPTHSFYPLSLRPPPVCRREFCLYSDQDHLVCSPTEVRV